MDLLDTVKEAVLFSRSRTLTTILARELAERRPFRTDTYAAFEPGGTAADLVEFCGICKSI